MGKNRHMSKKIDILLLFLRDYFASFSGREISRRILVSPQTALDTLNLLVKEKVLQSKFEGRNKKYSLNLNDFSTRMFLSIVETNKSVDCLSNFELKKVIQDLLSYTDSLVVFGSFAKQSQKKSSDIDIISIGSFNKKKMNLVADRFPREVNIQYVTWNQFVDSFKKKNHLSVEIKKDHLIFGNVYKVVDVLCHT